MDRRNGLKSVHGLGFSFGVGGREEACERTVYQFEPVAVNSDQKIPAENLGGTTTLPPERSGARKPARRPWCGGAWCELAEQKA